VILDNLLFELLFTGKMEKGEKGMRGGREEEGKGE
jgi:hypothetical protein